MGTMEDTLDRVERAFDLAEAEDQARDADISWDEDVSELARAVRYAVRIA